MVYKIDLLFASNEARFVPPASSIRVYPFFSFVVTRFIDIRRDTILTRVSFYEENYDIKNIMQFTVIRFLLTVNVERENTYFNTLR